MFGRLDVGHKITRRDEKILVEEDVLTRVRIACVQQER